MVIPGGGGGGLLKKSTYIQLIRDKLYLSDPPSGCIVLLNLFAVSKTVDT